MDSSKLVYVFVIHQPDQTPDGSLRARWMQQMFPQAIVQPLPDLPFYNDDREWARDFAKQIERQLGELPFDAVFSSELYGSIWAEAMSCEHVMVDFDRTTIPISARMIRADPKTYFEFIHPVAQPYYEGLIR